MNGRDLEDQPALPPDDNETAYNNPAPSVTSEQPADTSSTAEVNSNSDSEFSPNKKNRRLKLGIILLVLAVGVVVGGLLYNKHQTNQQAAKVAKQNKDIALLKVGVQSAAYGSLYPDMSANSYGYLINAQMFEGLVRYEGKSKLVPALASDWTNPDSKTWLFTVKKGIKFHDGHTLAASDVKYSLDKVIASDSDLAQIFASTIQSADVVGNNQVRITTKQPDPTLLNRLAFLYIIDANLPKGDEPSQAGTGPYEIKPGSTPTDSSVQMVAFDSYSGGRPTTLALNFGSEKDGASLVKAYQAGKYNIAGAIPLKDAKLPGFTQFISSEPEVYFIGFNSVKPGPLQNKLVREAFRYAVDPVAVGTAGGNRVTALSQLIPPSIPGFNPAITPHKRDVSKAKQLLAQAGYPQGLSLRFSTNDQQATITELANQLKQANITLAIDRHSAFDEFINYFSTGQADVFSIIYSSDTLDGLDIYNTTLSSANYNNPNLMDLFDQASLTVDPAKRLKLLQDAAVIIDKDVAVIPFSTRDNVWLMDKNYVIQQDMPSSYLSVYFSKVYQR